EGWVSLWNTYTRLFPGTFTGCSPPGSAPPLDSPLYAASPRPPPPPPPPPPLPMDAFPSRRNKASGMAGTPDVRGGGLLPASRASGGYPLPPVTPESGSGSRLPTTATVRRRRLNQRRPSTAAVPTGPGGGGGGDASRPRGNDAAAADAAGGGGCAKTDPGPSRPASSIPRPHGQFSYHRYQQPGEEEVVGHGDEILLDDDDGDDDDEVPPRGYSWGQLSRMPLEEAGRKLGTFSAKGFSTGGGGGGGGGGGDGRGCLDVSDCEEGGGGCATGSFEDDLDDNSDSDLELSEGLMFDLEM
ncbi:unnamed protein product, partial [Ectocarpus sp. 12 AP-2014]